MADETQAQQEFNQKVIDKLQEDPDFLGHLLQDPQSALSQAGLSTEDFKEDQGQVDESEAQSDDVAGHGAFHWHTYETYFRTCKWISGGQGWHWR